VDCHGATLSPRKYGAGSETWQMACGRTTCVIRVGSCRDGAWRQIVTTKVPVTRVTLSNFSVRAKVVAKVVARVSVCKREWQ